MVPSSQLRHFLQGLRLDICTHNRIGLLSDVTRVFRESGLSISRAELGTHGDKAVGSFYVTDVSGHDVNPHTVELVKEEIGGSVLVVNKSQCWTPKTSRTPPTSGISRTGSSNTYEDKPRFSLGSLLWSQLERLSSNFTSIGS